MGSQAVNPQWDPVLTQWDPEDENSAAMTIFPRLLCGVVVALDLHGSDAGYLAMAAIIDPLLFK